MKEGSNIKSKIEMSNESLRHLKRYWILSKLKTLIDSERHFSCSLYNLNYTENR